MTTILQSEAVLFSPGEERVLGQHQETKKLLYPAFRQTGSTTGTISPDLTVLGTGLKGASSSAPTSVHIVKALWEFNNAGQSGHLVMGEQQLPGKPSYEEGSTDKSIDRYNRKVARDF